MEIEQSSIFREILDVINSGEKPVHDSWGAQILIADNTPIIPMRLLSIDFVDDYLNNYGELIHVTMAIPCGTYAIKIYPFLDNIDILLTRTPLGEVADKISTKLPSESERYTAILIDTGNPIIEQGTNNSPSEDALNLSGFYEVTFQLINKSLEQLRMVGVGGNYANCTGESVVKLVLNNASKSIKVDKSRLLKGVDMVKASNQEIRQHVVIPQGTTLVDLPHHIHYKCGGLYAAGLGYFLAGDYWYVYPCFDVTRFNDTSHKLTIINIPDNHFPGLERTYKLTGDNLVILSTGKVKFRDNSNVAQLNKGNGTRFADATKIFDNFSTTKDNKTVASRGSNNSETIGQARPNGQNFVPLGIKKITANPYIEYSALAARQGSLITMVWENANRSLLYPGMPVKIMYLDNDSIKTLYGVLLNVHSFVHTKEPGMTGIRYIVNTTLGVFVKPLEDQK